MESNIRDARKKLLVAIGVSLGVSLAELIGGLIANSIAVIADAAHDAVDGIGFMLSLFFLWAAQKASTKIFSFGFKRAEVLGAAFSVMLIWIIAGAIIYEAGVRAQLIVNRDPSYRPIDAPIMFGLASFGLFANVVITITLGHGHTHFGSSHNHGHSHDEGGGGSHGHSHDEYDDSQNASHPDHSDNEEFAQHDESHGHSHYHDSHDSQSDSCDQREDDDLSQGQFHRTEDEQMAHHHGHSHGPGGYDHAHGQAKSNLGPHRTEIPITNIDLDQLFEHLTNEKFSPRPSSSSSSSPHTHGHSHSPKHESMHGHGHGESGDHEDDDKLLATTPSVSLKAKDGTTVKHEHTHVEHSKRQRKEVRNINVASAYAHAIGHVLQDIGVVFASILIWIFPTEPMVQLVDPIFTIVFSVLGLVPTFSILKATFRILMQGIPQRINLMQVKKDIERIPGVSSCHELHVWSLSVDDHFLSVHIVAKKQGNLAAIMQKVRKCLFKKHEIDHAAVQVEEFGSICMEAMRKKKECCSYDEEPVLEPRPRRSLGSKFAFCMLWIRDYSRGHNRRRATTTVHSTVELIPS